MFYRDEDGQYPDIITSGSFNTFTIPTQYLADSVETADMAAIIFPVYEKVGHYTAGGDALRTQTWLTIFDLYADIQYASVLIAEEDPPQTISVPVINGVAQSRGASGEYRFVDAFARLLEMMEEGPDLAEDCTVASANEDGSCQGLHKVRTEKEMRGLLNRLSRIEGQVRGIRRMVEEDAYCIDILNQVSAANSALNSFSKVILSEHIRSCVAEDVREGSSDKLDELIRTLPKLMK